MKKLYQNLLISTTENGVRTHESLLEAYTDFNDILVANKVQKPVCIMSDGHSSRFDPDVLRFMENNENFIFIGPPDTTGVTQTLDQINQDLHTCYRGNKDLIYDLDGTINRDGFMKILSESWPKWAPTKSIIDAAKHVGISAIGLDVDWMDSAKFENARLLLEGPAPAPLDVITPPVGVRKYSNKWYKAMYEESERLRLSASEEQIQIEKVPGLLEVKKARPISKKVVKITQVHGSLKGQQILEKVSELESQAEEKKKVKEAAQEKRKVETEMFFRCKSACVCNESPCCASRLKQCPSCSDVLKSVCSKLKCRKQDGSKPTMINVKQKARKRNSVLADES